MLQFIQENLSQILGYTLGTGGVVMAIVERRKK